MKGNILKFYLLGYLNEYFLTKMYLSKKDIIEYKKIKLNLIASYLKIPNRFVFIFKNIMLFLTPFEVVISLFILSIKFLVLIFIYFFTNKRVVKNTKLMLGLSYDKPYFNIFIKSAGITEKEITILGFPSLNFYKSNYNKISILSGISLNDLIKSYYNSFKIVFIMNSKYSNRDFLFRSYSSLEFFITCEYVFKSDISNIYVFEAQIDRIAYLMGSLNHETHFIQHGIISEKIKYQKIGKVDRSFYIDEEQKRIFEKCLITNRPYFSYRKNMNIINSNDILNNGKKNILLICNSIYFDKESDIIKYLSDLKVNLYIKPHPNNSYSPYEIFLINSNIKLLGKNSFPLVDLVISYESTLLIEYKRLNVRILLHTDNSFERNLSNLKFN